MAHREFELQLKTELATENTDSVRGVFVCVTDKLKNTTARGIDVLDKGVTLSEWAFKFLKARGFSYKSGGNVIKFESERFSFVFEEIQSNGIKRIASDYLTLEEFERDMHCIEKVQRG